MAGDKYFKDGKRVDFFIKGRTDAVLKYLEKMVETINNLAKVGELEEFLVSFDSKYDAQATFIDWGKDEEEEGGDDEGGDGGT